MATGVFLTGAWWSVHLAVADLRYSANTLESLRDSAAMAPADADTHALLAEQLEGAGLNPEPELRTAAELDPLESAPWLRLAFHAESMGDYARAETYLLRAASVDRKSNPKWALMNFYFRRGNIDSFWRWSTRALESGYGDLSEIFKLEWAETNDSAEILRRLPVRADLYRKYLTFLVDARHWDAVPAAASRLAGLAEAPDVAGLLRSFDRSVLSDPDSTLAMWNTLCARKLLPFTPLNPKTGPLITNQHFEAGPPTPGFDWRVPQADGVYVSQSSDSAGISVQFSGQESEDVVVLSQAIPTSPGHRYQVDYEYTSPDGSKFSGLHWEVGEFQPDISAIVGAAPDIAAASPDMDVTGDAKSGQLDFISPHRISMLRLRYRRRLGSVRAKGTVAIRIMAEKVVQ